MVKFSLIFAVALVLQCTFLTHAGEPGSAPRNTDEILAKLKVDIEVARNKTGIPGMSVAIMHKGKLIFAEGFGKRNQKDPYTPETRTPLASVTKAFTATTVGELVAEGKMDWDSTPVNTYLPEFETIDPILTSQLTMQDLLSHRTNFPPLDLSWWWGNETRLNLIKRIRHIPVSSKMRATINYNNIMYCVAGEAAAKVVGVPFEQLVRDKIFKPLGFSSMGFTMGEMSKSSDFAVPFFSETYEDAVAGRFIELPLDDSTEKVAAAGDLHSNVMDLARWGHVVMKEGVQNGRQVLSKEGVAMTLTAHTVFEAKVRDPDRGLSSAYGMGWGLHSYKGNNRYAHSGSNLGYTTNLAVYPDAELVVAVLTNADLTSLPGYLSYHVADEILGLPKSHDWLADEAIASTKADYDQAAEDLKGDFPKRVPNKPPAHDLTAYTGEYFHPGHGTSIVRLKGDELHLSLEAFGGVLAPYHFDSFSTVLHHKGNFKSGTLITFDTGADGKVAGVTFDLGLVVRFEKKKQEAAQPPQFYSMRPSQTVLSV
ncbi:MAG: beta-lactamase/transpeptidase-like protein [Podila humilis]|nr:MAG: beta-lactamase/transpeptidase-like protein [Podila humilis]